MKTTIFATALLLVSMAHADILRPSNISTSTITGDAAQSLYERIPGPALRGDALRTEYSNYKVQRSEDGLKQAVCEQINYSIPAAKKTVYTCTVQQSKDGQQIPVFHPVIRMG